MEIVFPIAGYLIGGIPFGLIIGILAGIDVRKVGSRNIGATNVNRVLGKKLGILTLICDSAKGFLPIWLAWHFLPASSGRELAVALSGVMAVVGHMFPAYLQFRGGKGVATGLGVFLFLSPWVIAISLAIFLAAVRLTGFVSIGSLVSAALVPLWLYLFGASNIATGAAAIITVLIWIKHHENIKRLLHGEEKSWRTPKTEEHNNNEQKGA
jgi:acyl phosphate:glycerol-3-phosphate acyltransferase